MTENNTKEVWVVDTILERNLIGTISENDIIKRSKIMDADPKSLTVEQCMKPILVKVLDDATIEECDRLLNERKLDQLAIVNKEGHFCGVYNPASLLPIRQ